MFEFSFAGVLCAILVGGALWHYVGRKHLGWVTPAEAAIKAEFEKLRGEAAAEWARIKGVIDLHNHRIGVAETALNPPTAAPVVPVALAPAAPPAAPPAPPAPQA